jgi:aminoglycoside phosphotransferase (APT) family kinase protein
MQAILRVPCRSMPSALAPDDVVATFDEVAPDAREPLLVLEPLTAFLDEHGIGSGDIEVQPVGEGRSNATFLVTRGDTTVVLRRPPRGPLPPSAHDTLREARVLTGLAGHARVPPVLAVCDDTGVIGVPFMVMENVSGHVITSQMPDELADPDQCRRVADELIDGMVEIHAVDWRAAGLEGFGRPDGYLERQLRRFVGLWEHNKTREIPEFDEATKWLTDNLPQSPPATIVHGDYRLGNTIFAVGAPARLKAVLDWEMSTIGDPLADIGYMTAIWSQADDPVGRYETTGVTRQPGFPSRSELVALYEERSGRSMHDIAWYRALAIWKSVVFMEGNYVRAVTGASDDEFMAQFGEGVVMLAQRALAITRGDED